MRTRTRSLLSLATAALLAACGGSSSNPSGNQDGTAQTDTTVDSGSDARDAQTGLDVLPDAVSDAQTSLDIRADAASDLQNEDQSADL